MALTRLTVASPAEDGERLSDEVELYQRTYTTLLRSSGETRLRVLEPSHRAMGSSLHALAGSPELDLGAFLYAIRRLPDGIVGASLVVMGQDVEVFLVLPQAAAPSRRSALEVIASLGGHRLFPTPGDVDRHLQEERDAWDR